MNKSYIILYHDVQMVPLFIGATDLIVQVVTEVKSSQSLKQVSCLFSII